MLGHLGHVRLRFEHNGNDNRISDDDDDEH
jgi:hypothetical protein